MSSMHCATHMQHSTSQHLSLPRVSLYKNHSCHAYFTLRRYSATNALHSERRQPRCSAQPREQHRRQHTLRACSCSDDAGSAARPQQAQDGPSAASSTVQPAVDKDQDLNQLTTALNNAIAVEDYRLAAQLRDKLTQLSGGDAEATADWRTLGIPEWLADRAERIGYRFPTGEIAGESFTYVRCGMLSSCMEACMLLFVQPHACRERSVWKHDTHCADPCTCLAEVQKRASRVLRSGADAVVQSGTGSGKTLAFVMPLLAALQYPPDAYPESFLVQLPP